MHNEEQIFTQLTPKISRNYPTGDIGEVVDKYIKDQKHMSSSDEVGLLSLLFSTLLGSKIDQQQKDQLRRMANDAMQRAMDRGDAAGGIVGETLMKSRILRQEVSTYFNVRSTEFDYFKVPPSSRPLANMIFRLECMGLADHWKDVFQKSGKEQCRIEFFENASGMGVWMSKKGIPFDETKLR